MRKALQTGRFWRETLMVCAVLFLAGCESDTASYLISSKEHCLTLVRDKPYPWSREWQLALVTSRMPDCMRRHKLNPVPIDGSAFKLDLFRAYEGGYILRQGMNYYVTETGKCQLQQFKAPPAELGEALGAFEVKEKKLRFVAASAASPALIFAPPAAVVPQPQTLAPSPSAKQ